MRELNTSESDNISGGFFSGAVVLGLVVAGSTYYGDSSPVSSSVGNSLFHHAKYPLVETEDTRRTLGGFVVGAGIAVLLECAMRVDNYFIRSADPQAPAV